MLTSIVRAALALGMLIGHGHAALAETRAPAQQNQLPVSFTWKSEYWPKGLRSWSQTAPDQWTEKYEDGTREKQFRVLRRLSMGGGCAGLLLKSPDGTFEVFIPGSRCSSKWLLYRNVGLYAPTPDWIGQAEIRDVQYAPAAPAKPKPR